MRHPTAANDHSPLRDYTRSYLISRFRLSITARDVGTRYRDSLKAHDTCCECASATIRVGNGDYFFAHNRPLQGAAFEGPGKPPGKCEEAQEKRNVEHRCWQTSALAITQAVSVRPGCGERRQ